MVEAEVRVKRDFLFGVARKLNRCVRNSKHAPGSRRLVLKCQRYSKLKLTVHLSGTSRTHLNERSSTPMVHLLH